MRLFIAIKFNQAMQNALIGYQKEMRSHGITGNYTSKDKLHLTLAFIGEYPDPDDVLDAMETITFEPFEIRLSGTGHFGDLFWAGIEKNEELNAYVKRLRHVLAERGIPFDRKKFSPHITLIRKMRFAGSRPVRGEDLSEILRTVYAPAGGKEPGSFTGARDGTTIQNEAEMLVEKISLMRSDRGKHGMIYTEL